MVLPGTAVPTASRKEQSPSSQLPSFSSRVLVTVMVAARNRIADPAGKNKPAMSRNAPTNSREVFSFGFIFD